MNLFWQENQNWQKTLVNIEQCFSNLGKLFLVGHLCEIPIGFKNSNTELCVRQVERLEYLVSVASQWFIYNGRNFQCVDKTVTVVSQIFNKSLKRPNAVGQLDPMIIKSVKKVMQTKGSLKKVGFIPSCPDGGCSADGQTRFLHRSAA